MSSFVVLIDILNTIHSLFIQNVVYFFIYETYTHSSVIKIMHEARIKYVCLQADNVQIFKIYTNEYLNGDFIKYDVKYTSV